MSVQILTFFVNIFDPANASMREVVVEGKHKMAAVMVTAADALWDARGGHDPTVTAAMTNSSRSRAPGGGEVGQQECKWCLSKKSPPFQPRFFQFSKPWQQRVQVSQLLQCKSPQLCKTLRLVRKLKSRQVFTG